MNKARELEFHTIIAIIDSASEIGKRDARLAELSFNYQAYIKLQSLSYQQGSLNQAFIHSSPSIKTFVQKENDSMPVI